MITTLALAAWLLSAPPAPAPSLAPTPLVQDIQDKRPEIKEMLGQFAKHIKKKGEEDLEAIGIIDKLVGEFPNSGPKDRSSIVKALDKAYSQKRTETAEGVPNNQLFIATATAMGEMGPESVKPLAKVIGHKSHRKDLQLQRVLILSLGRTKDDGAIKPLVDLLPHHEKNIQAATAEALGNFEDKELKVRKDIFEALLKQLMSVKGQVDSNVNDVIARERYDAIAAPLNTSLEKLSRQKISDPNEWQRWWNKNKKTDWDEGDS